MKTVFRVAQDQRFAYMRVRDDHYRAWEATMPIDLAARGMTLHGLWNENWEIVVLDDGADHPGGIGDFSDMNKMIATNAKGLRLLHPLLGDAAELFKARFRGGDMWLFNVTRRAERKDLSSLEEGAVFRLNPTRLDILCGHAFKDAVERSGLTGLRFIRVDQDDQYGMV